MDDNKEIRFMMYITAFTLLTMLTVYLGITTVGRFVGA